MSEPECNCCKCCQIDHMFANDGECDGFCDRALDPCDCDEVL